MRLTNEVNPKKFPLLTKVAGEGIEPPAFGL